MTRDGPTFDVVADGRPGETLVAGFSTFGLAGLTAADYLVDQLELSEIGHVAAAGIPSMTPFEDGTPTHHTRLFSTPALDLTVLTGEQFFPPVASEPIGRAILSWAAEESVDEVVLLLGVPIPHGPEEHDTFFVATDDYREARLADADVRPMGRGFLDGIAGSLVQAGLERSPSVCVYLTPVHAQVPDVEAAIRLVEAVDEVHDVGVDASPLQAFAAEVEQYYENLAERMAEREDDQPTDRMYM